MPMAAKTGRSANVESLEYDVAEHAFIQAQHEVEPKARGAMRVHLTALSVSLMLIVGVLVGSSAQSTQLTPC
jgi:hypothetical protein